MKNIKIENVILILLLLSTLFSIYVFNQNLNILFIANILICILTCIKSKFSIFSLKSLLINYVLVSIAFQYNTGESYGVLEINKYYLYYGKINFLALIYNIILYLFVVNTNIVKREENKMHENYQISKICTIICCIMAIIFSIIAFPSLKLTFSSDARFQALLPGSGWNHVTIIALILVMQKLKSSNIVKMTYVFCISWFLLHGERVDMIGLLFCCIILFSTRNISNTKLDRTKQYLKYLIIIFVIVFGMITIGEIRNKNNNFDLERLSKKILIQNTAADLGYVYNLSINYVEDYGFLYGKSYIHYIKELIPFMNSRDSIEFILDDAYGSPGGAFILSEPYMNFGILGILIFEICELYLLSIIIKSNKKYAFVLYLFLLSTTFRTSWYGLEYIETGIIYILPILYVFTNYLNKRKEKYEYKK